MILQSFIFLLGSILGSVLLLFVSYKFFKKIYLNILGISDQLNLASSILISTLLMSIGLHASFAMGSVRNLIALQKSSEEPGFLAIAGYFTIFIMITIAISFLINYLCFKFYHILTPEINEAEEIRSNNVPVALLVSSIIIVSVCICREAFVMLLETLIPYPKLIYK
ncbi:MAG: DUF350 domain-containing protein [Saprospiraceae bacterium]|nr:DUF350 domain-containing protein [Saprospiraceae bacterium]